MVNCITNTWPLSLLNPLGVPFKTYQAPPVKVLISMFCPDNSEVAIKAPKYGWALSSTVLIVTSDPLGWLSIPIVNQLSAASEGKNVTKNGLIPAAVAPVAAASL